MKRSLWLFLKRGLIPAFEPFCLNAGGVLRLRWETQDFTLVVFVLFGVQHYNILLSLSSLILLSQISFPRYPHSFLFIITGHVAREMSNPPILHKPPSPLFICITSQSNSYKYPSPSLSLHFTSSSSSSLLPAAPNRGTTERELLLLLPLFTQIPSSPQQHPHTTFFNLSPSLVKTGHSFRILAAFFSGGKT